MELRMKGKGQYKDPLAWVDKAARQERNQRMQPTEHQIALAEHLESVGKWDLFLTGTFRPNKNEEVVQRKNGEYFENHRLSWMDPKNRILKRRGRHGEFYYGMRDPAPGWSAHACERVAKRFFQWSPLKRTRWFYVVEGHKHRACAHWHALMANCGHLDLTHVDARWTKEFGRFSVEVVEEELGVAHYLAKGYVAKSYGANTDIKFGYSNNCRRPKNVAGSKIACRAQIEAKRLERKGEDGSEWRRIAGDLLSKENFREVSDV